MIKGFEEFQKMGQKNWDVAMKSVTDINKDWQAIADQMTTYTKKSFEEGVSAFEQLMAAKSVDQAVDIQTKFAKKAFDEYVGQMTKLSDMYTKAAKDAYAPVAKATSAKK